MLTASRSNWNLHFRQGIDADGELMLWSLRILQLAWFGAVLIVSMNGSVSLGHHWVTVTHYFTHNGTCARKITGVICPQCLPLANSDRSLQVCAGYCTDWHWPCWQIEVGWYWKSVPCCWPLNAQCVTLWCHRGFCLHEYPFGELSCASGRQNSTSHKSHAAVIPSPCLKCQQGGNSN